MNKTLIVMIMALVMGVSVNAAQINWGNQTEVYGTTGDLVDAGQGYFIRLYKSTDSTIDFSIVGSAINLGANDSYTGIQFDWNSAGDAGWCAWSLFGTDGSPYDLTTGTKFYSVIFDNSLTAGNCAIVDDSISTIAYSVGIMTYDAGGVVGGMKGAGGDWQAIPEPATIGLMGIGAGLAWLLRMKQRLVS